MHRELLSGELWALLFASLISFWLQAVVTEERLVPALNVFANHFHIPGDVAGATLMAAGASAPELFAMLISLFITHSSLGLGCIIGSEIFNQLVCVSGAVLASHDQTLKLDRSVVIREASFYALSLVTLLIAISDRREVAGGYHFYISAFDGILLLIIYFLYVLVCTYFEKIYSLLTFQFEGVAEDEKVYTEFAEPDVNTKEEEAKSPVHWTTIIVPSIPFLRKIKHEPSFNFHGSFQEPTTLESKETGAVISLYTQNEGEEKSESLHVNTSSKLSPNSKHSFMVEYNPETPSIETSRRICPNPRRFSCSTDIVVDNGISKPSRIHGITDLESNDIEDAMSCFLWQQSIFYNKAKIGSNAWQLRWFTFTKDTLTSVADRVEFRQEKAIYPTFNKIEVDRDHLLVKLHSSHHEYRNYVLMAPSPQILSAVVSRCEKLMNLWAESAVDIEPPKLPVESNLPLIAFPYESHTLKIMIHILLFPMKALLHYTIPDVRLKESLNVKDPPIGTATVSTLSCTVWLVVSGYMMCYSLERIAMLIRLPISIMGVTFSAAGTSIPVYVASQVSARQGFGNMAVSNAIGANSFNILFGLGLPWTLYTVLNGEAYGDLRDEGITASVVILALSLMIFLGLMIHSRFVLYHWHAKLFFAMYGLYVLYAFVRGYYIPV